MRVRCHAQGKFYTIECPEGTRLVRGCGRPGGEVAEHDHLVVPLNGKMIRIPADPPELLPLLAETGNFGVSLVGEPEPDVRLAVCRVPVAARWTWPGSSWRRARRRSGATGAGQALNCRNR